MKCSRLPMLLPFLCDASPLSTHPEASQTIFSLFDDLKTYLSDQSVATAAKYMLSHSNFLDRSNLLSCEQLFVKISPGDICFIDFGCAYRNEAGYQHFGIILSIVHSKAFVVPMTSNPSTFAQAFDEILLPSGKRHLMRIGKQKGMHKESVLFLNDCKFINTSRIIEVKGHIETDSELFYRIVEKVKECLFNPHADLTEFI
jgi:hypothetical protein